MSGTPEYSNRLLLSFSDADAALLRPHLSHVELPLEYHLERINGVIEHAYFIESGIASTVADAEQSADSHPIEIGLIGREGVTGIAIILGDDESSHSIYMQSAGDGYRIEAAAFRKAMKQSHTLHAILLKFVKVFIAQITETALANGRSKIEQRLARWLLMADDRLDEAQMPLRHEFISVMLGVRRPGVTVAIQALEGRGLIKATRGHIQIIDRKGLEDVANGCYGAPEAEYQRLIEKTKPKLVKVPAC
jgi:CRP-like cAMP-binding protein